MRGLVYTLEAALVLAVVLGSIGFIIPSHDYKIDRLNSVYECIEFNDRYMEHYAGRNDEISLKNRLAECFPNNFDFVLKICDSLSCSTDFENGDVYVVDHLRGNKLIRIWLWRR